MVSSYWNDHSIMNIPHFDISSLPNVVDSKCSHVCATCSSLWISLFISYSFQSFAYCFKSSTNAAIYFFYLVVLLGLFILHPSHYLSISDIIGTLRKFQLVPKSPAACSCLYSAYFLYCSKFLLIYNRKFVLCPLLMLG